MAWFFRILNGFKKILFPKIISTQDFSIYTKDILKGNNFEIGDYSYGRPIVLNWGEGSTLKIGKFCSIASNVKIYLGGNHRTDWVSTYPFNILYEKFPYADGIKGHPASKGDVQIGNDVWIGNDAVILSGVKIMDGAVVAANSVVTKNIGPYEIWAGNPAKKVKKRFDESTIEHLLEIQWWYWSDDKINKNMKLILSDNIHDFIEKHQKR